VKPATAETADGLRGSEPPAGRSVRSLHSQIFPRKSIVRRRGDILDAAIACALRGWEIFPAPPGKKKSYKSAEYSGGRPWGKTKDLEEIKRDWARWPDANIAIATGPDSGFWVVEADTLEGHDVDGIASLKRLEAEHGPLPETLTAESPSGSQHRYFKWPADVIIRNSASTIAPGVDVRGDGGMVIAPPSVKPGKGGYCWLNAHDIADAPEWLIQLASKLDDNRQPPNDRLAPRDIAQLAAAVDVIPNDIPGWEDWNRVMMAIWAATGGSEEGFKIADHWCAKWEGYDATETRRRWEAISKSPPDRIGAGTIFYLADKASPGWRAAALRPTSLDDFVAYLPAHSYVFLPTREPWPASSVDSQLPPVPKLDENGNPVVDKKGRPMRMPAHSWLDKNRPVQQMTWAPGWADLIPDKLVADGGWIDRRGTTCLNLYRPPTIKLGNAAEAKPWVGLVKRVYPDECEHIIKYFAQRVQQTSVKINHCLVLGGPPGIGKDTILEAVKHAVGAWNFLEVAPSDLFKPFNGYVKSVILRISEARDLGEVNRYAFYEHTKTLMASPPDVLRCNEKFLREHSVFNVTGVVITTNHKTDGIYLPEDDRRHFVAWSTATKESFPDNFWQEFWRWYQNGGLEHVAAYLSEYDLAGFDPKAPPPKTKGFWEIVDANRAPEDSEMADALDKLENPLATTLSEIVGAAGTYDFEHWLEERKNRRAIPHRLERRGYVPVASSTKDRLWVVDGKRQVIYARADLPLADQIKAAEALVRRGPKPPPKINELKPWK
jgi:Bifunctional DNA primase/polymerase, N-terminal/Primase C terminal 2 (PriCT-2)/Family of unknown function (DUF5906)